MEKQPWYVIGHKNPDADAICAAIGHAAFLQAQGKPEVHAARCGEVPLRVKGVLKKAGMPEPELVEDVRPTAGSICRREVVRVKACDTFMSAYQRMVDHEVRSVPVVDDHGEVMGLLRYLDLLQLLLPAATDGVAVRNLNASLENIAATLSGNPENLDQSCESEEELIMMVGASSQDTVERRLREAKEAGNVRRYLVICGDRPVVHRHAVNFGARALVITGDYQPSKDLAAEARKSGTVIICCAHDTATTVKLALCSRRVSHVLTEDFRCLSRSENLVGIRREVARLAQDLFPVVEDASRELIGVISKSDLVEPPRIRLSLVDHNEFSQAVRGVEEAEVIEILDHHRLSGDLTSREPVRFINEPVGSSSTIVARRFQERGMTPEANVAMCLCAGIISDTLNLTSPTTTALDGEILEWLSGLAGVEPESFAEEFFASGSLLVHGDAASIVRTDRKEFTEEGVQVSLSQVEELSLNALPSRKSELLEELEQLREAGDLAMAGLLVTDVRRHESIFLAVGDDRILAALPYPRLDEGSFEARGVVSRKKQLFPAVCRALRALQN